MGKIIEVSGRLTTPELKKLLASEFGVKRTKIDSKALRNINCISGVVYKDNYKLEFIYWKDTHEISISDRQYKVTYLRSTPFGYGGGWENKVVEASSEEEALQKAEKSCKDYWGALVPCSYFKISPWNK